MAVAKTNSQLRIELRQAETEVSLLRSQQTKYEEVKKQLEETLENLTIYKEELRVQNEQLRHMQRKFEESSHKYFDLFEGAPIGYFILTEQGMILEANIMGAEILGRERQRLIRTLMKSHVKPSCHIAFSAHLDAVFSTSMSDSVELELEDGGAKSLFVILESVSLSGRRPGSFECRTAMIDITERKQLELQLHHAQKLESLGVLAGGIAHDFNNLLASISSNAGIIRRMVKSDSAEKVHLEKIEMAALRGGELANQMLAYSGRDTLVSERVDLTKLVEGMGHLLEVAISKSAVLSYDLGTRLPPISGDPSQIRQIILNLMTNASEAIGERSGVIRLSTGMMVAHRSYLKECCFDSKLQEGNVVYVEVHDSGTGINSETMKKIFDPFFTTKFPGRGMGLAALVGIVRAHGGTIHVISIVDQGSSFRVIFPIAPEARAEISEDIPLPLDDSWKGSGSFLIVDDDEDIRMAGQVILEQLGFTVLVARDGREGLRLFKVHVSEIRGVLLDLTMPHLNGPDTLEAIREISKNVPVIISSGYTQGDALQHFKEQKVNGFIQKPYLIEMLLAKVKEVFQD